MINFTFLQAEWPALHDAGTKAKPLAALFSLILRTCLREGFLSEKQASISDRMENDI
jgi:hypothetical protein